VSAEDRIHANMDRYIDGMKMNRGHLPSAIHLFERDYRELLKAENNRRKAANPKAETLKKLEPYKGIPVVAVKTK